MGNAHSTDRILIKEAESNHTTAFKTSIQIIKCHICAHSIGPIYVTVSDNKEGTHVPPTGKLYKPHSKKKVYNIFIGEGANRCDQ